LKTISWRSIAIIVVLLVAFVYALPSVQMLLQDKEEPTLWPYKQINLGLDLQGGMHLVLQIETEKAVENMIDRTMEELRAFLRQNQIRTTAVRKIGIDTIAIGLADADKATAARGLIVNEFDNYTAADRVLDGKPAIHLTLRPDEAERVKRLAFEKAMMRVRNRVDEYGAREPEIRPQGEDRIVVQLPGVIDAETARREIGRTGNLEFKLVDDVNDIGEALRGNVPPGSEIRYYRTDDPEMAGRPILLRRTTLLTGEYLSEARVRFDPSTGQPYVSIRFNPQGARIFARITEEHIQQRLAIVLDNEVYSAPTIQSKITGEGMITGNFTDESARNLALVLREAFPTPVQILYEKTVGPSLGRDSIEKGLRSMLVGGMLVIVLMIVYYGRAGIIADLVLLMNIVLIAGGLAALNATLTLPGIAGIILTIGMAVDANVLIFERIREEMRMGKTLRAAVAAGFDRATLTILDANVTTLLAAMVLFQFGTGPVQGFAVTLGLGVMASMFTALILSRTIFDLILTKTKIKAFSI
jgi:preprotein translocase subunit SecD